MEKPKYEEKGVTRGFIKAFRYILFLINQQQHRRHQSNSHDQPKL